ncbi:MAG: hypothetical protein AAGB31_14330 [Bdellovibrio sp.]
MSRKPKEREVKELALIENQSNYAGSNLPVTQADFEALSNQRKMLRNFTAGQLMKDVDFGIIKGTPKNSLYKPGAEKLNRLFGLGARFFQTDKEIDRVGNYASYTYKCEVYHLKSGQVIAECEGVCTSHEKKYKSRAIYEWVNKEKKKTGEEMTPIADIQNTLMKMAQKRAFVGATILAVGASDFFTQDLEDFGDNEGTVNASEESKKGQFSDDDRTKRLKGLIESCRKVGISEKDICSKFKLAKVLDLTDDQARELGGYGQAIKDGTQKVSDIFKVA